jgi:hypothetical protein
MIERDVTIEQCATGCGQRPAASEGQLPALQDPSKVKTSAFDDDRRLAERHGCCGNDVLLTRIGDLSATHTAYPYAGSQQLQNGQCIPIERRRCANWDDQVTPRRGCLRSA